jgi:hypothetical protein
LKRQQNVNDAPAGDAVIDEAEQAAMEQAAEQALDQMVAGLARFCLSHGIPAVAMERALRRHFIHEAKRQFEESGTPATVPRLTDATGFPQFYVEEALARAQADVHVEATPSSELEDDDLLEQLMLLVTKWSTDTRFTAFVGVPITLPITSAAALGQPTFSELLEATVPGMSRDRAIQALLNARLAELEDDGKRIKLISQVVSFKHARARNIRRFGRNVAGLMGTLTTNATRPGGTTLVERTMTTDGPIPFRLTTEFHETVAGRVDQVLGALDAEQRNFIGKPNEPGTTWGICAFLFEVANPPVDKRSLPPPVIDVLDPRSAGARFRK